MQKKDCFPGVGGGTYQTLVVRQHDDYLSVVVPDHPPKVCGGVWQRMLGDDKLVTPEVTLKEHESGNPVTRTEGCVRCQTTHHRGVEKCQQCWEHCCRRERHTVPLYRRR